MFRTAMRTVISWLVLMAAAPALAGPAPAPAPATAAPASAAPASVAAASTPAPASAAPASAAAASGVPAPGSVSGGDIHLPPSIPAEAVQGALPRARIQLPRYFVNADGTPNVRRPVHDDRPAWWRLLRSIIENPASLQPRP
jgi:hypothetical protein